MKTKLTLSVSAQSVRRAKAAARRRGVPLSRLVEEHFDLLAPQSGPDDAEGFFDRWQGAFQIPPASAQDDRAKAIAAKHLR